MLEVNQFEPTKANWLKVLRRLIGPIQLWAAGNSSLSRWRNRPPAAIGDRGSLLPKRVRPDVISRKGQHVGKDQNTYAKRQREMNKKRKAEDKRVRRQKRKEEGIPDVRAGGRRSPVAEHGSFGHGGAAISPRCGCSLTTSAASLTSRSRGVDASKARGRRLSRDLTVARFGGRLHVVRSGLSTSVPRRDLRPHRHLAAGAAKRACRPSPPNATESCRP